LPAKALAAAEIIGLERGLGRHNELAIERSERRTKQEEGSNVISVLSMESGLHMIRAARESIGHA
jgi:hypothetical protein